MDLIEVQKHGNFGDDVYGDVLSHCKRPNRGDGRYTDTHETSHFISSELRQGKMGYNGFYILNSKGVLVKEPPTTIGEIAGYVPSNLRGMRYQLYLVDQRRYWDEQPLYIVEELNCYFLGGACALDDHKNGRSLERTDAVAGMFEFRIYSTAVAMCVKEKCPEYWDVNKQFHEFMKYRLSNSMEYFLEGREIPDFQSSISDKLYNEYTNSSEGERFEQFIKDNFSNQPKPEPINWTINKIF